jgi:hypothetical protein
VYEDSGRASCSFTTAAIASSRSFFSFILFIRREIDAKSLLPNEKWLFARGARRAVRIQIGTAGIEPTTIKEHGLTLSQAVRRDSGSVLNSRGGKTAIEVFVAGIRAMALPSLITDLLKCVSRVQLGKL